MIERYLNIAREVIDLSLKQGAEQVSVSLANATSFQLEVRNQNIEALKEAGSSGIHVTLAKNQKRSTLSSNDFRLETLEPLIRSTLEALPLMGEDPFYTLPDPKLQGKAEIDLQFRDPNFEKMASNEKINELMLLEKEALSIDSRLQTEEISFSDSISYMVHGDSNGFLEGCSKTLCSQGVSMFAEDGGEETERSSQNLNTGRKQSDGWYSSSRFRKDLESREDLARKAGERTLRKLGSVKPKSCEVPVVFSTEMAQSFLGSLASAMMGDNVFRKHSFLKDSLGETVANPEIRLSDEPLLPGKLGSRHYDSEGVKATPLMLIDQGKLLSFMCSTYSANKLDRQSTGHAGGISNLMLKPGNYSDEELVASIDNGLYLTGMSGQGVNLTTGDYSRGAQGLWIRKGKLAEPVSEFTIASTFPEMLKGISMIGSEVDERSTILTPAFRIDSMNISGS